MKLNAEQIKKALECCGEYTNGTTCNNCPYMHIELADNDICSNIMSRDALTLITSMEQRIGAQDMTISELRKLLEKANHDADRYAVKIKELTEENEYLTDNLVKQSAENVILTGENKRLMCENGALKDVNRRLLIVLRMHDVPVPEGVNIVNEYCDKLIAERSKDIFGKLESKLRISFINGDEENAMLIIGYDDYDAIKKEMGVNQDE